MFDSDAPKSNRKAYIGMSNYAAGRLAGEKIMEQLPNGDLLQPKRLRFRLGSRRDRFASGLRSWPSPD